MCYEGESCTIVIESSLSFITHYSIVSFRSKSHHVQVAEKRKGDIFDACRLVDHEPWDDELKSFLNVHYNPLE